MKRCPFCNGVARYGYGYCSASYTYEVFVECRDCLARAASYMAEKYDNRICRRKAKADWERRYDSSGTKESS